MNKKYLRIIIIIFFASCTFLWIGKRFAPGSYPYSEKYELNYPYSVVKNTIIRFKKKNKIYLVPKVTINNQGSWNLTDGPKGNHWYRFYFYIKDENKILFTLIRELDDNKTEFSFVSINDGLNIGNWKNINDDLGFFENSKEKKNFKKNILTRIEKELSNNQNDQ